MLAIGVVVAYLVYIAGAVAAMLVPIAAILFVVGRSEAATRALLYSLILGVVAVSEYSIVNWVIGGQEGGGVSVNEYVVAEPPKYASLYYPVEIYVIPIKEAQVTYKVRVEWGDGLVSEAVAVAPRMVSLKHPYNAVGLYSVDVYIYEARSGGPSPGQVRWCIVRHESFVVNVSAPWVRFGNAIHGMAENICGNGSCGWFDWECYFRKMAGIVMEKLADIFMYVSDFINRWMAEHGFYAGYAFYYYVAVPDTANFPAMSSVYYAVAKWALLPLPVALIINIMWRAYWKFSLLDIGHEFVWVLFVILAGIYVYDAAAAVVNTVSLSLSELGQLSSVYGTVLSFLVTSAALGVVSPVAANIAAIGIAALLFLVLGGVLKWVLVAALAAAVPVLAMIWLIPPLRGVASMFASMLSGLMVFTLVAAVFARLIGELSNSFALSGG